MIKILYPPGCYGSYMLRSLYYYTDLRDEDYTDFLFDDSGSSHVIRDNDNIKGKMQYGHLSSYNYICPLDLKIHNQLVVILPCENHILDYNNNQFLKNLNGSVKSTMLSLLPVTEIDKKMIAGWNWNSAAQGDPPDWIKREFISFWIMDYFKHGYRIEDYKNIPCDISIDTQDIFLNFFNSLNDICQALDLKITIDKSNIIKNHDNFLKFQQFHNSQLNCERWVDSIIHGDSDLLNPCKTIFDEAYVQHLLRQHDYKIHCNGLDIFPATSNEMKLIIYKS